MDTYYSSFGQLFGFVANSSQTYAHIAKKKIASLRLCGNSLVAFTCLATTPPPMVAISHCNPPAWRSCPFHKPCLVCPPQRGHSPQLLRGGKHPFLPVLDPLGSVAHSVETEGRPMLFQGSLECLCISSPIPKSCPPAPQPAYSLRDDEFLIQTTDAVTPGVGQQQPGGGLGERLAPAGWGGFGRCVHCRQKQERPPPAGGSLSLSSSTTCGRRSTWGPSSEVPPSPGWPPPFLHALSSATAAATECLGASRIYVCIQGGLSGPAGQGHRAPL